jgi:D-alanyl-D-alanine carboxypeptidase (penicillin-binding protein 5/6)
MGENSLIPLTIKKDLVLTLPRKARKGMKVKVSLKSPIAAPIIKGTALATLKIEVPGKKNIELPLVAGANVSQLSLFLRLGKAVEYLLWGDT